MATKRKFDELREIILQCLHGSQKTVNQISSETQINWKTVDNHLIYLVGTGMVNIVFSSQYVKIFELTDLGKEYIESKKVPRKKKVENK